MDEDFTVSGSDAHKSELTEHLEAKGAKIFYGQKAENVMASMWWSTLQVRVPPDNRLRQQWKKGSNSHQGRLLVG